VMPYQQELTRNFSQALWVLLAAVALLLLIASANLANLMLVRASERRREMAIRQALGASRARLARQLLVESALLSVCGAALGVLLAHLSLPALVALVPANMPRAQEVALSLPVLLFSLLATAFAGVAFGLVPALRAARVDPNADLKSEGRGGAGTREKTRARGGIVAAQVALMAVLLTGAGLLLRSFREVMRIEPGFAPNALAVRLALPRKDYATLENVSRFYRQLEARVAVLPGVLSVAAANQVPLNGALASADYKVADRPPASESQLPTAQYRLVTPAYFRTLGIPLLAGRGFDDTDRDGAPLVAIVSRGLARTSFPDRDAVGRHLLVKDNPGGFRDLEIVGVVGDVKHGGLEGEAEPHLYVPYHQTNRDLLGFLTNNQYLLVRGEAPAALAESVRSALRAVDPNVASANVRTTGDLIAAATAGRRFAVQLIAGFAGLALLLAALGIYGVVAYTVAQRTRETGVRMALGALRRDILGMVLGDGLRRTAAGVLAGLLLALAASRALQGLLYGVSAVDPVTYVLVAALLLLVTLAACLVPAWRATRVDPIAALRSE